MKLSNKILLGGFLSIIVLAILFSIFMSVRSGNKVVRSIDYTLGAEVNEHDLLKDVVSDFSYVGVTGMWELEIIQGDKLEALYYGDEYILNQLTVEVNDNTLEIRQSDDFKMNNSDTDAKIVIVMPEIKFLDFKGAGDIYMEGFNQKNLIVEIEGLVNIVSNDSKIDKLSLKLDGMGNADFSNTIIRDLNVTSSMMGNLEFGVDNAKISGNVDGMGAVTFHGSISSNNLNTSGMVEVNNK